VADLNVFQKAKQATEQAAAKAAELKEQASAKATELRESVATRAQDVKDQASAKATELRESVATKAQDVKDSVAATAADLREAGNARIKDAVDELNTALPVIRQVGFSLSEVKIEIGIPPKIVAIFQPSSGVTEESFATASEEHAERKLTTLLVRSLYHAWRLQKGLVVGSLKPHGIEVEIGLSPSVTIKFAPSEEP
jgi:hypothetical protein